MLDSDTLSISGQKVAASARLWEARRAELKLPDYVKNVTGDGTKAFYQEINPTLNTDTRLSGINALLSQIGYKVGFSNGYFVFNEQSGIQTATQIEADQQRTIQLIKSVRDQLCDCICNLIDALNAFADLYDLAPRGAYSLDGAIHMSDITYSFEEDRMHHYTLAMQGKYPWEEYYVNYLKVSREEAKQLLALAKNEQKLPTLFAMED